MRESAASGRLGKARPTTRLRRRGSLLAGLQQAQALSLFGQWEWIRRMKMPSVIYGFAAVCLTISAQASPQSKSGSPAASSPMLGLWKLDLESMPIPAEARPTSVTVEFADIGAGTWTTNYVIIAKDGNQRRMTSRERLDGKAVAIEGDQLEADSAAMTSPAPGVLVMGLAKSGRPGSVRVYTISADGTSMTESAANVGDDGKPFIRTFRWVR